MPCMLHNQATSWKLEDAIQLYFIGNEGGAVPSTANSTPTEDVVTDQSVRYCELLNLTVRGSYEYFYFYYFFNILSWAFWFSAPKVEYENERIGGFEDEVRPPLPVKREALYDDATLYAYVLSTDFYLVC